MTVLVGLLCQDGVVIGSDSSSTFSAATQQPTIEQKGKKVDIIGGQIITAGTGQAGLDQRFDHIVQNYHRQGHFAKHPIEIGRELSQLGLQNFGSTGCQLGRIPFGALMGFCHGGKVHLCEFAVNDFQPEFKTESCWYVSMGSGQNIADPFLGLMRTVFWKDTPPNCNEGVFYVAWALTHTIELNPGGINGPMQIGILQCPNGTPAARLLSADELSEHADNIRGVNEHLAQYIEILRGKGAKTIPAPPASTPAPTVVP